MAFRLRAELAAAAGLLLIALGAPLWTPDFGTVFSPPQSQTRALSEEMAQASARYQEAAHAHLLMPLLPAAGDPVRIAGMAPADSAAVAAHVRQEIGDVVPRARVAVFQADTSDIFRAGMVQDSALRVALRFGPRMRLYFGGSGDDAYCFTATTGAGVTSLLRTLRLREQPGRARASEMMATGPCRFWAKYSAPGAQIASWLHDGHARYLWSDVDAGKDFHSSSRRGFLGTFNGFYLDVPVHGVRCLSGQQRGCIDALDYSSSAGGGIAAQSGGQGFGYGEGALFAMIEEEFGSERFARFWSSGADLETAFAGAFGVAMDEWLMRWAQQRFGVEENSPRMDVLSVLLSLLTAVAALGAGAVVVQRRRIA